MCLTLKWSWLCIRLLLSNGALVGSFFFWLDSEPVNLSTLDQHGQFELLDTGKSDTLNATTRVLGGMNKDCENNNLDGQVPILLCMNQEQAAIHFCRHAPSRQTIRISVTLSHSLILVRRSNPNSHPGSPDFLLDITTVLRRMSTGKASECREAVVPITGIRRETLKSKVE